MIKTPLGEIKVFINEKEIRYSVIDCMLPEAGQTLFCYKIVVNDNLQGDVECKINIEKNVVTRNADYNCATIKTFERDNFYLELCGLDVNNYICHTTNNGLMYLNFNSLDKLEFLVAWVTDFKDASDQRVWRTIKTILSLED